MTASQWFWLVLLSVLWGGSFFFVGVAVNDLPALTLVWLRVALAASVLIPIALVMGHRFPSGLTGWIPFAGMAIFNNVIPFTAIVMAQQTIASGLASILNATTPIWSVLLLALAFRDERLTTAKLLGVFLGFLGVVVLMGPTAVGGSGNQFAGIALMLVATFSYGCSAVWGRRLRGVPAVVSASCQLISSTVLLLPIALIADQPWTLAIPGMPTLAAVAGLAVASTALAYLIFFHILSVSGSGNVMLVTLLIPVSAVALGGAFLNETLEPRHFAGAAVIASALLILDGRLVAWLRGSSGRNA